MRQDHIDFPSRVSGGGIAAGVITTYSTLALFTLFAGGVNLVTLDSAAVPAFGPGLWIFLFFAWPLSSYIGGFISGIVSRSTTARNGKLYGFLTWASSQLIACALVFLYAVSVLEVAYNSEIPPIYLLGALLSSIVAIVAGVYGGFNGAVDELIAFNREEKQKRAHEDYKEVG